MPISSSAFLILSSRFVFSPTTVSLLFPKLEGVNAATKTYLSRSSSNSYRSKSPGSKSSA